MKKLVCTMYLIFIWCQMMAQVSTIDSLKSELAKANNDSLEATLLLELGNSYKWKNVDTAHIYFSRSFEISTALNLDYLKAQVLLALAWLDYDDGKIETAMSQGLEALNMFQEHNDSLNTAHLYIKVLGPVYSDLDKTEEAIKYIREGANIYSSLGFTEGVGEALTNLGGVFFKDGDLTNAIKYTTMAIDSSLSSPARVQNTLDFKTSLATSYNNLAFLNSEDNRFIVAEEYYLKSLDLFEKTGQELGAANIEMNMAENYLRMGNISAALEKGNKSYQTGLRLNNHELLYFSDGISNLFDSRFISI